MYRSSIISQRLKCQYNCVKFWRNPKKIEFDPSNNNCLQQYIDSKFSLMKKCDNYNKYMIMLYGPPACGKSYGMIYGIQTINNIYKNNLIRDNFIEINVDDIVGDISSHQKIVNEQLKICNNTNSNHINHIEAIRTIKKSYWKTREKYENIAEIMIEKCIQNKVNFTMESTGSNFGKWHYDLFQRLKKDDYKIIFIYLRVTNEDLLVKRAYERGLKLGRFITKEDYKQYKFIDKAESNFEKILQNKNLFDVILIHNS
jgi:predicted ABC-type ATPase